MIRHRLLIVNSILLLALLGGYWGIRSDDEVPSRTDFLRSLNLSFRGWKATDKPLGRDELEMLKPDDSLMRQYESPDAQQWVQLAVIAGHRKESIHTPAFCMVGSGWEVMTQGDTRIHLPDRTIVATRAVMGNEKDRQQIVVTYLFTDGDYCTRNLPLFNGVQLWKRLRRDAPIGALVRLIVPVGKDPTEAEELSDEFAQATLPSIMATLRSVHLQAR